MRRRPAPVALALAVAGGFAGPPASPGAAPLAAQPQLETRLRPGDTVWATPLGRYDANAFHRLVLGHGHRDLWSLPVRAPVLDPSTFAGGLEPLRLGGGNQTRSLRLQGADGVEYQFRSIDKDATRTLDPLLRESLAADVLEDLVSSLFPLSAMVVAPILDAAGILHPEPRLVVMPDDPALGPFREEFAGLLGWIEIRPDEGPEDGPGFAGSSRVVGSPRFLERLEESPANRVDAEEYLRARLIDVLVGDWDRHPDQWRWAGFPRDDLLVFEPVPRDRDWALARIDGLVGEVSWVPWPQYTGFGPDLPNAFRMTWSGRALDRRLLSELEREDWTRVVDALLGQVTDDVLRDAVARLPASYREAVGPELEAALLSRRAQLPGFAAEWYALLSGQVDVHLTDVAEAVRAEWLEGGAVRLTARGAGANGPPHFERTFRPGETREVRVYLHGGHDEAVAVGEAQAGPTPRVRFVGGGGDDRLVDGTAGRARVAFHDHRGDDEFVPGPRTEIDDAPYDVPDDWRSETHQAPPRDWGVRWVPVPRIEVGPDVGVLLGFGARRTSYRFRHYPWATRFLVSAGVGTATGRPSADVVLDVPVAGRTVRGRAAVVLRGAELHRFYGFGNGTDADGPAEAFEARRQSLRGDVALRWAPPGPVHAELGTSFLSVRPDENPGTVLAATDPYGAGDFERLAVEGRVGWSGGADGPDEGAELGVDLLGRWVPAVLDAAEAYGGAGAVAVARLPLADDGGATLALRAGGEQWWGRIPYFDAAYLGGSGSLRGYRTDRFAGEAMAFGGAELRVGLGDVLFLLPLRLGVSGLAEVGRVFAEGDPGGGWHGAWGGGVWASFVRDYGVSATVARGEDTLFYLSLGMPF